VAAVAGTGGRSRSAAALVGATGAAGLLTYVFLALPGRGLVDTPVQASAFAVFWSVALVVGFGLFAPVEQELARTLGAPGDARRRLRAAAVAAAALVALGALGVLALADPLLELLGGQRGVLLALLGLLAASGVQFWVRGALLGSGRTAAFAGTVALDSALRVLLAGGVALVVAAPSAASYAWVLVASVLLAHAVLLPVALRGRSAAESDAGSAQEGAAGGAPPDDGLAAPPDEELAAVPGRGTTASPAGDLVRALPLLLVVALCSQVLLNAGPVVVRALEAEGSPGQAARFLFAFTLARAPLFVAVPLQGVLVPPMAALARQGRTHVLRSHLVRLSAGVLVGGLVAAAGAAWLGPAVLGLVFGAEYGQVSGLDLALMVLGAAGYLGLLVVAAAHVATGRHGAAASSWVVALAVAAVTALLVPGLFLRVELALLLGTGAGWAVAMVRLVHGARGGRAAGAGARPGTASGASAAGAPGATAEERA